MLRGSVPSIQSSAQHTFARAPQAGIPRSKFNRSHGVKTTFDEGYLVPVLVDEMLPGDTFSLKMHAFARMATPIYPIMDNLYLESFFFSVPYRLVWTHWEQFNGANIPDTNSTTDYTIPQCSAPAMGGVATGDLQDYMGIPIKVNSLTFNNLHMRAYNLIWNDWFRDQNLQNQVTVDTGDGPDTYTNYVLLQRGKRHDYFTSCLPFPQKGPDVEIPLGTSAPVYADALATPGQSRFLIGGVGTPYTSNGTIYTQATTGITLGSDNSTTIIYDPENSLYADLSTATAATINALRLAWQTQKLYERDARGGTRYTEIIKSHFGVISPDMRLQRPEYLGGGSTPVVINPVAQTAQTTSPTNTDVLGNLAAYGVCAPQGHGFTYSATEHCLIIGLVSVRADINYQQGLERMWSRQTRLDYYWPALSHIGEQVVLNQEIYAQGNSDDTEVFGYQERFAEYRYKPSQITGLFRSTATSPLDAWHLAQKFTSLPTLGSTFIVENAPMSRIEAVSSQPDFLFDCFFSYHCARPMPVYAIPGLVDHF
ncbi:MAG: major capsid protein [Microviridae sp. ctjyu33]|nr:MAG: major capsid protein [Microviridae sp. ctjyu33]